MKNKAALSMFLLMSSQYSLAVDKLDVGKDLSGGKTLNDVFTNVDDTAATGAGLLINLAAISGYVIIIMCLWQLYKASKDEREKPTSALIGLVIGGVLAGVATVMWIIRNSVLGS